MFERINKMHSVRFFKGITVTMTSEWLFMKLLRGFKLSSIVIRNESIFLIPPIIELEYIYTHHIFILEHLI